MKRIFLLLICLSTLGAVAQSNPRAVRFKKTEHFSISLSIDPTSSVKEKGVDALIEVEYNWLLNIKAGIENFQALEGGYTSFTGGIGFNLTHGFQERFVYTGGIRLGVIHRGFLTEDSGSYPLFGWEGQVNYRIAPNFIIGLRGTLDWREDFLYTGGDPSYRGSGFVTLKYTWKRRKN